MYIRILLGVAALAAVYFLLRWFARTPPATVKRQLLRVLIGSLIGLLVFLAVTGRLHWLFALGASLLPFLRRLLPLIRYVPLLRGLASQMKARANNAPAGGQHSQVESRFLNMRLDHDSGDLDGVVLAGQWQGHRLSELSLEQLLTLLKTYRSQDGESAQLLEAYLDRCHEDWRDAFSDADAGPDAASSDTNMTRDEAYRILGLEPDASQEDIIAAHRRLMQKLHPDRGGSSYLAAKINQAKDLLSD